MCEYACLRARVPPCCSIIPSALLKRLLGFSSYRSYYDCMNTRESFLMHTSHLAAQRGPIISLVNACISIVHRGIL